MNIHYIAHHQRADHTLRHRHSDRREELEKRHVQKNYPNSRRYVLKNWTGDKEKKSWDVCASLWWASMVVEWEKEEGGRVVLSENVHITHHQNHPTAVTKPFVSTRKMKFLNHLAIWAAHNNLPEAAQHNSHRRTVTRITLQFLPIKLSLTIIGTTKKERREWRGGGVEIR